MTSPAPETMAVPTPFLWLLRLEFPELPEGTHLSAFYLVGTLYHLSLKTRLKGVKIRFCIELQILKVSIGFGSLKLPS